MGGDTNEDGNASSPARGNWNGLSFYNASGNNVLDNIVMRWGSPVSVYNSLLTLSDSTIEENYGDGIYISSTSPLVTGCVIRSNSDNGIELQNSDATISDNVISKNRSGILVSSSAPTITENRIWGNREDGVRVQNTSNAVITFNKISTNLSDGIDIRGDSNTTATNNQIFMNREYGLRNDTEYQIDATQTWWGNSDASGPYHETTNTNGTGNQVSDNVNYTPFQTTVATQFSYRNFSENAASTYGSMTPPDLIQGLLSDEWDYGKRPEWTMAWDENAVILDYSALQINTRYKIRVAYFNGDHDGSMQSLTDGNGNLIHGSIEIPTIAEQFEFSIPSSFYTDGNLRLKFIHDNPATSEKAAVSEIWLIEDDSDSVTQPRFEAVEYNDADDNETLSIGDVFIFNFSEDMDTSVIKNGTTDANNRLTPEGGAIYGTINETQWVTARRVIVTLTHGFTVTGTETVTPNGLTDVAGNTVTGSHQLLEGYNMSPDIIYISFDDADGSGSVSVGDRYFFGFSEPMRSAPLTDNTTEGNVNLPPEGKKYGYKNRIAWNESYTECIIWITSGFSVTGNEVVDPTDEVTDRTGNPVSNTGVLTLSDIIAPLVAKAQGNYINPVGSVIDYRVTIQFDSAMDIGVNPVTEMINSAGTHPIVPENGTWQKTVYDNDTYVTPDIDLSTITPGQIQVNVSGAKDVAGNEISPVKSVYEVLHVSDEDLPETQIISGIQENGVTCFTLVNFCWTGSDSTTSTQELLYSWKLDDQNWSSPGVETCHEFTELSEGNHALQVRAHDTSGNTDPSPAVRNFSVDQSSPVISEINASGQTDSVIIKWITDKPATSQVEYGPTDAYGTVTPLKTALTTSHSLTITGLTTESTYHFRIKLKDACGTEAESADQIFETATDTDNPDTWITSGPLNGVICVSTVEICWTGTDNVTPTENLQYSYKLDTDDWSDWTSDICHQYISLSEGLHTFQINAKDTSGNLDETPPVLDFTIDTSQPTISNISVVERQSSVSVTWSTNKKATSQVEYGSTNSYGFMTQVDNRKVNEHRVKITGLTPETTCHFRVRSDDGCIEVVSQDSTFTTTPVQPPNLFVSDLNVRPSATPLSELEIRWKIRNEGQGDAEAPWTDSLYLSTDNTLNDEDTLLGEFNKTGGLTAYFDYWQTEIIQIPNIATGPYYIILKTDSSETVNETDEEDNIVIRPINITTLKVLTVRTSGDYRLKRRFDLHHFLEGGALSGGGAGSTSILKFRP
ncbi:MAG: hypothetical protein GY751_14170, partial [Bacteroidetes bacterium]|nr:hypothetical protein [Bacteroidota bacterium]